MGLKNLFSKKTEVYTLCSPIEGTVIPLEGVEDEVFSKKILGDGFAVIPSANEVCAPTDGKIDTVFDTAHAVSMTSDFGAELLIHCGIDTVKLNGEGFSPCVKSGDTVKKGDVLLQIDAQLIKQKGFSLTTPVVVLNSDSFSLLSVDTGDRKRGESAATLEIKKSR